MYSQFHERAGICDRIFAGKGGNIRTDLTDSLDMTRNASLLSRFVLARFLPVSCSADYRPHLRAYREERKKPGGNRRTATLVSPGHASLSSRHDPAIVRPWSSRGGRVQPQLHEENRREVLDQSLPYSFGSRSFLGTFNSLSSASSR